MSYPAVGRNAAGQTSVDGATEASAWAVACTLAIGFALLSSLRSQVSDLGGDETWTRLMVRLPLADAVPFLLRDGKHPPLYAALQRALGAFLPDSAAGLRALSIAAASLIPTCIYVFARRFGAPVLASLGVAFWAGSHPVILAQAINARSYALFALFVILYAGFTVDALLARTAPSMRVALSAALVMLTHAFGVLFVGAVFVTASLWLMLTSRDTAARSVRALARVHVPAAMLCMLWYVTVAVALRGTAGVGAGLEWVEMPTRVERVHTLGGLLGSADVPFSTRTTLALWSLLLALLAVTAGRRGRFRLAGALVGLATLLPFIAQNLASGIIAHMPMWGIRHVAPTVGPMALGVVLTLRPGVAPAWWSRIASLGLTGLACVSLTAMPRWRNTMISDVAAIYRTLPPGTALRAGYAYGNVNTLNFYVDRRCLDDYQFRVLFPDVRGAASYEGRPPECVARPGWAPVASGERRMILVYRSFRPEEVRMRDSLVAHGWSSVYHFPARAGPLVAELLSRD